MGAELGRISGPLLSANLLRDGVDLAFETDLLYLNVIDGRVGINTDTPIRPLQVNGTFGTLDFLVPGTGQLGNLFFSNGTIQNSSSSITIRPNQLLDPRIVSTKFATSQLEISDQLIENVVNNSNIVLTTNGTGRVVFNTNKVYVDGDLHATGNITWEGDVTIGNSDTDSVTFSSDITSNIVPDQTNTYDLGSTSRVWRTLYSDQVQADTLTSAGLTVNNIDMLLTQGNTIYVSINGLDTNTGEHLHNTFRTIKHALSVSQPGDEIVIFPGDYEEIFPLIVPQGVSVKGASIRSVTVRPTPATKNKDAFLLNGETTVSHLTVRDFLYDSSTDSGYGFRFAPNATVTSRSPYIQNVTILTSESTTPGEIYVDPEGLGLSFDTYGVTISKSGHSEALVQSWIGKTLATYFGPSFPVTFYTIVGYESSVQDPSVLWNLILAEPFDPLQQGYSFSIYPSGTTFILPPNDYDTTGASIGEPWVAYFKTNLPPDFNTVVGSGWSINNNGVIYVVDYVIQDPVNSNQWRIYVTTPLVPASGIPIFSSPSVSLAGRGALVDGSVVLSTSKEASMLFYSVTFIVPNSEGITATNGSRVEWLNSFSYYANRGIHLTRGTLGFASQGVKFGAELRSINSANVYGTYGAVADGEGTLAYLVGHNFGYIGTGTNNLNDNSIVIQANEVVELNNGKIYYDSMDHKGDYRIGDIFYVNQETGTVTFDAQSIDFGADGNITFEGPTSTTIINKDFVQTGNIRIYDNNVDSLQGPVNLLAASGSTYLNTDVFVTGNMNISNDVITRGIVYIGNSPLDLATITPNLTQNINPKTTNLYSLGSDTKRWDVAYIKKFDIDGIVDISNNSITALTTDGSLNLVAAGTGVIKISSSDVTFNQNLTVGNILTVDGDTNLKNTQLVGDLDLTGNYLQTGLLDITGAVSNTGNVTILGAGNYLESSKIKIQNNNISVTETNSDIVFSANGSGQVKIEEYLSISNSTITNTRISPVNDTERSIRFSPNGTGSTVIDSVRSLRIPVGNQTTMALSAVGEIRYNNTSNLYEGWTPTGLASFNDVWDSDRNTYITAELTPGANDNILRFAINGAVRATIDSTKLSTSLIHADQIEISTNTIRNLNSSNELIFSPNGTGYLDVNNIDFRSNTITNNASGALTFVSTGLGYVRFNGSGAIIFPYGTTGERRLTPEVGEIRNNSTLGYMEVYTGNTNLGDNGWIPGAGISTNVTEEQLAEINDLWTLILG